MLTEFQQCCTQGHNRDQQFYNHQLPNSHFQIVRCYPLSVLKFMLKEYFDLKVYIIILQYYTSNPMYFEHDKYFCN